MRLAIADPPYPPTNSAAGVKKRATRWYGDRHPDAAVWNDPARHRRLLLDLVEGYDGFAIATTPDGLAAYGQLPPGAHIMVWVKRNAPPGNHRLHSKWEPVILFPPESRRNSRGIGVVPDVLVASAPRSGFPGAKPPSWTRWVLDAMTYDPNVDTVDDLFPGSGMVQAEIDQGVVI